MKGENAKLYSMEAVLSAIHPTPCAVLTGGILGVAPNWAPVFKALNGLRQHYHKGCLSPPL